MKKLLSAVLALLLLTSLAAFSAVLVSCDKNDAGTTGTEASSDSSGSGKTEGKTSDINPADVVKIVTDEAVCEEGSPAYTDWAATSFHSVYDFSAAAEIKNYVTVYVTDPDKYHDTDRILSDGEFTVTWSEDHTSFEMPRTFMGLTYNVQDVLDCMESSQSAYTAFLKNGSAVHVSYGAPAVADTEGQNEVPADSSKEEKSGNGKVTVLKNFIITSSVKGITSPYVLYRMGDEFMAVHANEITYFVKDGAFYKCVCGEISGGSVEWDSDWYDDMNLFKVFSNAELEFFATLMDNNSYCANYCQKTNETLTVAGVDTVKYADESFAYYINEATGLCFRNDMDGYTAYIVESYETACIAFPYAAPAN